MISNTTKAKTPQNNALMMETSFRVARSNNTVPAAIPAAKLADVFISELLGEATNVNRSLPVKTYAATISLT